MTNPDCSEAKHRNGSPEMAAAEIKGGYHFEDPGVLRQSGRCAGRKTWNTVKERTTSFTISYKFTMNTQEKEPELGEGVTSAEFWVYDGKLGRRWNVDPRPNISMSSYSAFSNCLIGFYDFNGDTLSEELQNAAKKYNGKPVSEFIRLRQEFYR
jgi:hypothetical protein